MNLFRKKDLSSYSDEQLLQAIGRGDNASFDCLYGRYADKLYRYFFRLLDDATKAEDFLQDLFLKVLHATHTFDPKYAAKTWLYSIATNMCRNEWRNTTNRQRLMTGFDPWEHEGQGVPESMDARRKALVLHQLMAALEPENREILQLRFQQDMSIREIAAITGLPEGTVKSRIFYLLRKMAGQLTIKSIEL